MKQLYEQGRKSEEKIMFSSEYGSSSCSNVFSRPNICNQYGKTSEMCCVLVILACMQDDVEEQFADIDSEDLKYTTLQDLSSEENDEDLEWCHYLISDKAAVLQFMGEQSGVDKTAGHKFTKNFQHKFV
jgi:hypothetical protein